jgi:hypothetical protein
MRRTSKIWLSIVIALVSLGALAYAFRDPLATALIAFVLEHGSSVRCNHPHVALSAKLDVATLSPLDCVVSTGPLLEAAADGDVRVELKHFKAERVSTAKATLNQRERDVSHVHNDVLGDLAKLQGFGDRLVKSMLDASESYAPDSPEIFIDELIALRGGKKESVMHGFHKSIDGVWNRTQTARIGGSDSDLITVRDLDMHVTPSRGTLTVKIYFGKPQSGHAPDMRVKLEGRQLDQAKPNFKMTLDTGS